MYAAGFVTGAIWLLLAATGMVSRLARLIGQPVILGMVLGLGLSFMVEGVKLPIEDWPIGLPLLLVTLLLLNSRRVPAMLALLAIGAALARWRKPEALATLTVLPGGLHWPSFQAGSISWDELVTGTQYCVTCRVIACHAPLSS